MCVHIVRHCRLCYPQERELTEKQYRDQKTAFDKWDLKFPEIDAAERKNFTFQAKCMGSLNL